MCGIAGWVGTPPPDAPEVLASMVAALHHRGPDSSGQWIGDGAAIGMARLAIIDLAGGDQPKTSGTWHVVFNGEIYNFRSVRQDLEACGRSFASDSDSEVVAHAIAQWDLGAFARLDGMYAIAAYDAGAHRLLLARDQFGEKPLYVWTAGERLAFASELKALRPLGDLGGLDEISITQYLHLGYVPPGRSIWADVLQIPPGHHAEYTDGQLRVERTGPAAGASCDEVTDSPGPTTRTAVDELDHRLREAVSSRLVADVEVGVLLSGGIDSSLVAAHAAAQHPGIRTFTIAIDDPARDESGHASAIARALGARHMTIPVTERDALGVVYDLARIYDEPFADSSSIPTVLLCRAVGEEVKVALAGDGGDEMFSGYSRHTVGHNRPNWARHVPRSVPRVSSALATQWWVRPRGPITRMARATGHPAEVLLEQVALTPTTRLSALGADTRHLQPLRDHALQRWQGASRRWAEQLDVDLYLPGDLLVKVDRASMAFGLEIRVPFLAPYITRWVTSIAPDDLGPPGAKQLSRALALRYFGRTIADRPKQGFSVPLPRWLRGGLRPLADEIGDGYLVSSGILDRGAVRKLRRSFDRRFDPAAGPIWAIAMFELWYRTWSSSSSRSTASSHIEVSPR